MAKTIENPVTPLLKKALQIYKFTYGLLPPMLGDVYLRKNGNLELKTLAGKKRKISLIWTAFCLAAFILLGILASILFLKQHFMPAQVNLKVVEVMMLSISITITGLFLAYARTAWRHYHLIPLLNNTLANGVFKGPYLAPPGHDIFGLLMNNYIVGVTIYGTPVPLFASFFGLNPCYTLIREWFLPPPSYITLSQSIVSHVISFLWFSLIWLMFFKYLFVILTFPKVLTFHILNHARTLLNSTELNETRLLKLYVRLRVLLMQFRESFSEDVLNLVVSSQFFITIMAWIMVKGVGLVPDIIVVCAVCQFISGVTIASCLLQLGLNVTVESDELVMRKRAEYCGKNRSRSTYYLTLKWRAQLELPIMCGEALRISKSSIVNYIDVLNENITTAVLL